MHASQETLRMPEAGDGTGCMPAMRVWKCAQSGNEGRGSQKVADLLERWQGGCKVLQHIHHMPRLQVSLQGGLA